MIFCSFFKTVQSYDIVFFLCFSVILTEQGLVLFLNMNFTIYVVDIVIILFDFNLSNM
jgi:hypothetical protein